ncbi:hypothetical protein GCM10010340_49500 [Streptomyces griseoloalbus]|nr:hypothetical protein GCM10010340_49500 [Streptomyces albaduncus]
MPVPRQAAPGDLVRTQGRVRVPYGLPGTRRLVDVTVHNAGGRAVLYRYGDRAEVCLPYRYGDRADVCDGTLARTSIRLRLGQ